MRRALILSGGGARGAFQVGAWQYLEEIGWEPDLICGSSVGAINAAAIGSGMSSARLAALWRAYTRRRMYRLTLHRFLLSFGQKGRFSSMMDTRPLRELLTANMDFAALRACPREVLITTVNIRTSRLRYFSHREITIDHLMAATAMPLIFPWQEIDGDPYWDGGVMVNTPIRPALDRGIEEIIAIMLSPVGCGPMPSRWTHMSLAELVLEQFLVGSFTAICEGGRRPGVRIATVAPSRMLGLRSLLEFNPKKADALIREGYRNTRSQLRDFLR